MPLGLPVDPEVYKIKSGSSAFMTSGSQVVGSASMRGSAHTSLLASKGACEEQERC